MSFDKFGAGLTALAIVCSLPLSAATLTVGQPAPALTFTEILQAPTGTKTDWPSLRGRVVVLEFWATWCAGCIEEIPHLNSLIQSLPSSNIQFIAADDEDPAVVKKFLAKMPINGWLGLDTSKKIIEAYDAQTRPRTVVIDPQGRIAGILSPHLLAGEQLIALADGKPVVFPEDEMTAIRQQALKSADAAKAAADPNAAGTSAAKALPKPIFDISIRPGNPDGRMTMVHRPSKTDDSYSEDIIDASVGMLMQFAGGVSGSRLTIHGGSGAKYTLHVSAPGGDVERLAPALQLAIVTATGMKLEHVTKEEDAYVISRTAASVLQPAAAENGSMCFYNAKAGKLVMMNASIDSLAQTLEGLLGEAVVNEASTSGEFDANFDLPKADFESVKAALEKNFGLTLSKARRNIERVVLDGPQAAEKKAEPSTSADRPGFAQASSSVTFGIHSPMGMCCGQSSRQEPQSIQQPERCPSVKKTWYLNRAPATSSNKCA
jgi:thiol-disulfide isomerase/thioredoxin